jgi:hypothetical protein
VVSVVAIEGPDQDISVERVPQRAWSSASSCAK